MSMRPNGVGRTSSGSSSDFACERANGRSPHVPTPPGLPARGRVRAIMRLRSPGRKIRIMGRGAVLSQGAHEGRETGAAARWPGANSFAQLDAWRRVVRMSSLREWMLALPSQGHYTFTTAEARVHHNLISPAGTAAALDRAEADRIIASPVRGFHVVLPLEDRGVGTPSWRLFLDPLMTYLELPYYVGLLTAASIHGASAQAAQAVQVVVSRPRRPIRVGRLAVEFVVRRTAGRAPVELVTTPSGRVRVATPEVIGFDLIRYPARSGGWDNVLTVLRDLAPSMRRAGMRSALGIEPATPDLQRLGHLLSRVGADDVAAELEAALGQRRVGWVPFAPGEPVTKGSDERDGRWRVVVNVEPEAD